jgi:hypothetical protein
VVRALPVSAEDFSAAVTDGGEGFCLLGGNNQFFPLDQFMMSHEITINRAIAISDAGYFSPRILFKNGESSVL